MNRTILGPILTAVLTFGIATVSSDTFAGGEQGTELSGEKSEADYSKAFDKMIQALDRDLNETKKRLYVMDSQLPKLQKRAEAAKYRVTAAREEYDDVQSQLASSEALPKPKVEKLRKKLAQKRSMLEKDAVKLDAISTQAKESRTEMTQRHERLTRLKDDVAIEADRFDPEDRRQSRVRKLLAESDWALSKLDELNAQYDSDLIQPVSETVGQARVE